MCTGLYSATHSPGAKSLQALRSTLQCALQIAEQHGINWKSLWLINDISEPHNLQPGSNIRIGRDYLVAPNESLATVR